MKKYFLVLAFFNFSFLSHAQLYCDFQESQSFYNESSLIKNAGYTTEEIVVKQFKNKVMEDSFKVQVIHFNQAGQPVSRLEGSKWQVPVAVNILDDNGNGKRGADGDSALQSNKTKIDSNGTADPGKRDSQVNKGSRYEFDSVHNVKKVFFSQKGAREKLFKLVFYDDLGKVSKIDFLPGSERVLYHEYVYKKNKLKIYTVTDRSRENNEEMKFNDAGQLTERKVWFLRSNSWTSNSYYFTYNSNGLLATETKKTDGEIYTVATHYYH